MANVTVQIATSLGDTEERVSNGNITGNGGGLNLGHNFITEQIVGMRFPSITIPQGATIDSANIQFQANGTDSSNVTVRIACEDSDDAPALTTTTSDLSDKTETTANTSWTPDSWTSGDKLAAQLTPDFKASVQEVVDRVGWASGNALVVLVSFVSGDSDGERDAEAFDGLVDAPEISIDYTVAGGGPKGPLGHPLHGPFGGPI